MTMGEKKNTVLVIIEDGKVIARGIRLPETLAYVQDGENRQAGYTDMGSFLLEAGSHVTDVPEKLEKCVVGGVTTKNIIFQSASFAAKVVLGAKGNTDSWK